MSIIQQAIDNKPLIQQIVTNLLAGKSSEDIVAESKLSNLAQFINKLKQQLVDELLSKRYAKSDIKQLLADRLSNLNPIQSILGDLHERLWLCSSLSEDRIS